jgi:ABC-type nitrate/sulfonate/bicarbonate transport system ATPase subunit
VTDAAGVAARTAPEPLPLLALDRVRIRGRAGILIDRFDLTLAAGESVALMGPSGCGKSLLLRVAAGLDRPDGGSRRAAESLRPGFVFQEGGLLRNVTVEENLRLPLYYRGVGSAAAHAAAHTALDEFGVGGVAHARPSELLNETRILVQMARAAALQANLIFLDDPFPLLAETAESRVVRWIASRLEKSELALMMTAVEPVSIPQLLAPRVVPLGGRSTREDVELDS